MESPFIGWPTVFRKAGSTLEIAQSLKAENGCRTDGSYSNDLSLINYYITLARLPISTGILLGRAFVIMFRGTIV